MVKTILVIIRLLKSEMNKNPFINRRKITILYKVQITTHNRSLTITHYKYTLIDQHNANYIANNKFHTQCHFLKEKTRVFLQYRGKLTENFEHSLKRIEAPHTVIMTLCKTENGSSICSFKIKFCKVP